MYVLLVVRLTQIVHCAFVEGHKCFVSLGLASFSTATTADWRRRCFDQINNPQNAPPLRTAQARSAI